MKIPLLSTPDTLAVGRVVGCDVLVGVLRQVPRDDPHEDSAGERNGLDHDTVLLDLHVALGRLTIVERHRTDQQRRQERVLPVLRLGRQQNAAVRRRLVHRHRDRSRSQPVSLDPSTSPPRVTPRRGVRRQGLRRLTVADRRRSQRLDPLTKSTVPVTGALPDEVDRRGQRHRVGRSVDLTLRRRGRAVTVVAEQPAAGWSSSSRCCSP